MNTESANITADTKMLTKAEIISLAEKTKYYCELLIGQSENWGERAKGRRGERAKGEINQKKH
jgi:hypothetical protein